MGRGGAGRAFTLTLPRGGGDRTWGSLRLTPATRRRMGITELTEMSRWGHDRAWADAGGRFKMFDDKPEPIGAWSIWNTAVHRSRSRKCDQ